ncbi:hypothetical protein V5799_011178, partial [Amblyomma americanum]
DHDLTLTWYHDGGKLTTAHETVATSRGGWKSLVTLGPLRRGHLHSNLTCAAASDVSFPASVTVPVDMFLAPTAVTIWSWPLQKVNVSRSVEFTEASGLLSPPTRTKPFESGQAPVGAEVQNRAAPLASVEASLLPSASRSFECEASGSRPAANITWFLDGRPVEPAFSRSVTQGNVTTSMLFVPPTVQSARLLECRATNGNLPENLGVMSHFLKMDTSHKTEVSVRLGAGLNASDITEGVDVYMECSILAASKVTEVSWRRDGHPVKGLTGHSGEALVTSRYLVIRGVNVTHSGRYTCRATSADGETTESAPLALRVRHSPRCVATRDTTLAAVPGEPLNVTCPVRADPGEGLRYFWIAEDNAGKRRRMRLGAAPAEHADGDDLDQVRPAEADSNRLEFLVDTYLFHATLFCWARNSVGVQREPCRFRFQLRHERFSSLDCTVGNYTDTSFSLTCTSRRRRDVPGAPLPRLHVQLYDATAGNRSVRSFRAGNGGDGYENPVRWQHSQPTSGRWRRPRRSANTQIKETLTTPSCLW